MERVEGIEPSSQDWQSRTFAAMLYPQNLAVSVGLEPTMPFGDGLTVRCNAILLTRQKIAAVKVTTAPA